MRRTLPSGKAARMKAAPTWWDAEVEDAELRAAMRDIYTDVGRGALQNVSDRLDRVIFKGATTAVIGDLLENGGTRIKDINDRTLQALTVELAEGTRRGYSIPQLIDGVPEEGFRGIFNAGLENGTPAWSDTRAETIARTETMLSYNRATLTGYGEFGITHFLAYDGDDDPECAERNGQEFSLEDAQGIDDHPNGTLVWSPIVGNEVPETGTLDDPNGTADREAFIARTNAAAAEADARFAAAQAARDAQQAADLAQAALRGPVKPVSAAFDDVIAQVESHALAMRDPQYKKVIGKIKDALSTIDKTFNDGVLPKMPRIGPLKNGNTNLQGAYTHLRGVREPYSLEFRSTAHMETVFHEATHFIDHLGLGIGDHYGSTLGWARVKGTLRQLVSNETGQTAAQMGQRADIMAPVARAIMKSDGYKLIETAATKGTFGGRAVLADTVRWSKYASDPHEAFARAMAQYLAKRHGKAAIKELESRIYLSVNGELLAPRTLKPLGDQWDWDDFAPIERAITKMLKEMGWLIK